MKPLQYIGIGAALVLLLAGAFGLGRITAPPAPFEPIKTDTITKIVSVYKDFPVPTETAKLGYIPIPRYKFLTDTIKSVEAVVSHDTTVVYLPRERKYYNEADGKLRLWIGGYQPELIRYELDIPETTITETVGVPVRSHWGFGVSAGYGISIPKGGQVQLAPYLGIGLTYNIVTW